MWHGLASLATTLAGFGMTWLVQSSLLLTVGLAAGRILKRSGPAVQSAVYRTTLAAVLICPIASALLASAGIDGFSWRWPTPAAAIESSTRPPPTAIAAQFAAERSDQSLRSALFNAGERSPSVAPTPRIETTTQLATITTPPATIDGPKASARFTLMRVAAISLTAWVLGSIVMGLRLWLAQRRMWTLRRSASVAEPEADSLCRDLAARMNVDAPAVWRSPFLFSPCLDGLRKPAILLPEDAGENLRETFVHELAHLARRDGVWNLFRRSSLAALWCQPLLWVLSRRLEATAEDVCDDYVVHFGADRSRYAGHLLQLAGRALPPVAPVSVGMVSLRSMLARRVVRIMDTSRLLSTRVGGRAVTAMLVIGVAGTVLAGLIGVGDRVVKAQDAAKSTAAKTESEDEVTRGQVVAPDGKPIAGATVIASRARFIPTGIGDGYGANRQYLTSRMTTNTNGRFEVTLDAPKPDAGTPEFGRYAQVIATAPGFGLGYALGDKPIQLRAGDQPIDGRVVDLEGRPVRGVTVRLGQVWIPAPDVARGKVSQSNPASNEGRLGLDATPLLPDGVATDADGRFHIEGLGLDVRADLTISGPTVAFKRVSVLTRVMNRVGDDSLEPEYSGLDERAIHGAHCTILVEPTRPIQGIVRDAETNQPIPGAVVTAAALSGSTLTIEGMVSTETDAQGRYRLVGLPKERATGHKLSVYPPLDQPYFITRHIEAPAAQGFEPITFDIALKRGLWITGKVTEVGNGKPVNAAVDYFPLLVNEHAKKYPNFNPNISASIEIKTRYKTDREGRFRIVGLPGGGVVTAHTDDKSFRVGVGAEAIKGRAERDQLLTYDRIFANLYQCLKEIDVPAGASSFTCDLGLDRGRSVRVRLVDENGAAVTNAVAWGRYPEGSDHGDHNLYGESVALVGGLVPGKPRTVLISHRERKIGAVLTIPADGSTNDAEITIALRPTATLTGRLVSADGKPATGGVRIELIRTNDAFFQSIPVADAKLDVDGRFRAEVVPAGGPYRVTATNRLVYGLGRKMEPETFAAFELAKDLTVEPGQALDFGTTDVSTKKRVPARQAPAATSKPTGVAITGRVVDLEGRPVAGVSVKVGDMRIPKRGDLSPWLEAVNRGEPPWTTYTHIDPTAKAPEPAQREATTDNDGRFRLEGLPADCVVGLALQGNTISYSSIDVATRKMDAFAAPGFPNTYGPGRCMIYGSDFIYTAPPSRPIEGVVKDSQSGKPLAGVEVRSYRFAGSNFIGTMPIRTTTDVKGHFHVLGMPKGKGNRLIVVPNDDEPYFLQEMEVPDPPGAGLVSVEAAMHRGVWIEGKVTEKATGRPVSGAWLHYLPFLDNPFAQAAPMFDKHQNTQGVAVQDRYQSKADGTFRLVGLPGHAIVGVMVYGKPYLQGAGSDSIKGMNAAGHFLTYRNPVNPGRLWPTVMKEINPSADSQRVELDLEVTQGASARIRIVDPQGEPVVGVKTQGRSARGSYERDELASADAEVINLVPDEERTVLLRHEGRQIGKVIRLRKGDDADGAVVVKLEPVATLTGRVTDADGNAVPGATVRPDLLPSGDFGLNLGTVATDAKGRFVVLNVPIGCEYAFVAENQKQQFTFLEKAAVKPGETTDVGDIRFKSD
jgi:beta-lactamase regulating signal transducer with metallopeptidase domain